MEKTICDIPVEIFRKKTRNIIIRVNPSGKVSMTVPISSSIEEGARFFRAKEKWVKDKISKFSEISANREKMPEDEIYYFEEKRKIVVEKRKGGVYDDGENLIVLAEDDSFVFKIIIDFLKKVLLKESRFYFDKWKEITGLYPSGISVRTSYTRWGSCNFSTKKISLSVFLANMPKYCLDYVVLHEIAHLKYPDHGKEFKAFLTRYMPEWRIIKKYMNDNAEIRRIRYKK